MSSNTMSTPIEAPQFEWFHEAFFHYAQAADLEVLIFEYETDDVKDELFHWFVRKAGKAIPSLMGYETTLSAAQASAEKVARSVLSLGRSGESL